MQSILDWRVMHIMLCMWIRGGNDVVSIVVLQPTLEVWPLFFVKSQISNTLTMISIYITGKYDLFKCLKFKNDPKSRRF